MADPLVARTSPLYSSAAALSSAVTDAHVGDRCLDATKGGPEPSLRAALSGSWCRSSARSALDRGLERGADGHLGDVLGGNRHGLTRARVARGGRRLRDALE